MIRLYSYYLTQREPAPGCMPGLGLFQIVDYEERRYIPEIRCEAYAKLLYDRELSKKEVNDFELIPETYDIKLTPADVALLSDLLQRAAFDADKEKTHEYFLVYKKLTEGARENA